MEKQSKKKVACLVVLVVLGILLLGAGIAAFALLDTIIRDEVTKKVIISNTSEMYDVWQDIPIPVYMQFWMFDVDNVDEILNGEKPSVRQKGPYTYRERRVKYNIVWNPNGTVSYKQNRTFHFIRDMSVGNDSDLILTINPLIAVIAQNVKFLPGFVRTVVSEVLELMNEKMFTKRPVRELLFGYDDPSLVKMHQILPAWFDTTMIGFFMRKNYTDDGLYTVDTGAKNISTLGIINRYNGQAKVDIWTTRWANMVNGTDGSLGPPFRFHSKESPVFVSDICRSIRGVYSKDTETPQGISVRRFAGDQYDMANASVNPDNIGFCTPQTNCLPTGLLNSTLCQEPVDAFRLPVIFSFPHFLYADPRVQQSVAGLNPNEAEHETVIDVEPWTGLVLQVAKRLQLNMFVEKEPDVVQTGNMRRLYFPIFWLNESSVVDNKHADMLIDELFTPMAVVKGGRIALVCVGGLMIVLATSVYIAHRRKLSRMAHNEETSPFIASSSNGRNGLNVPSQLQRNGSIADTENRGQINSSHGRQQSPRDGVFVVNSRSERQPLLTP